MVRGRRKFSDLVKDMTVVMLRDGDCVDIARMVAGCGKHRESNQLCGSEKEYKSTHVWLCRLVNKRH
jgi:hypothetical protein